MQPKDNLKPWPNLIAERRGDQIPVRSDDPFIGLPSADRACILRLFSDRSRAKMTDRAIKFKEDGKDWYTAKL